MPAVATAGALALAACGGGSDTPPEGNPPGGNPPASGTKTLALPDDRTIGSTSSTVEQSWVIEANQTLNIGGLFYTCESTTDCVIRVPAGQVRRTVSYTGDKLSVAKTDPRSTARAGNVPQPTAAADPLSAATIAEAFKTTGRKATVWAVANSGSSDDGNGLSNPHNHRPTVTLVSGETINLDVAGSAALHWGSWIKYTAAATPGGKRTGESAGQIFGGTMPRYGMKPDDGIDTATYSDINAVRLHFKDGSKDWARGGNSSNDGANFADLKLTANFAAGKVGGMIEGVKNAARVGGDTTSVFPDVITLKETDITATGTFDGDAEFKTVASDMITRKSGAWDGAFFGSTTAVSVGSPRVEEYVAPSDVAGTFEVAGRHGTGSTAKDLHVRGAFGSAICTPSRISASECQ